MTATARVPRLCFVLALALAGFPAAADAQDEAPQLEDGAPPLAQQRYVMGRQLYRQGQLDAAAREFQSGLDVFPTSAKLAYNLARTLERLNQQEKAIVSYERYLELAPGAQDRAEVERLVAALRKRVAEGHPEAVVMSTPPGASVFLDNEQTPVGATPLTLRAAPGSHIVRFQKPGYSAAVRTVDLVKGQQAAVVVILESTGAAIAPAPADPAGEPAVVAEADTAPQGDWRDPTGWAALGVGAAALGVGTGFSSRRTTPTTRPAASRPVTPSDIGS